MTPRAGVPHMPNRMLSVPRLAALVAAAAALAACASDEALVPAASQPAHLVLATSAAGGLVPLASLGDTATVISRVLDASGNPVATARLRWTLRPAGVVAQDAEGVYRAVGNGRVTVVAEVEVGETGVRPAGYYARPLADSVVLEVRQRPARLALAPVDTAFGTLGAARQLRAQVTDARGNALLDGAPALTWVSADPRVVTVDGAGLVRSLDQGAARVSVHAAELTGAATFTVQPHLPHTSCMVFAQRRQTKQACVTLDFVMREREAAR
jgi:hypothetical protein